MGGGRAVPSTHTNNIAAAAAPQPHRRADTKTIVVVVAGAFGSGRQRRVRHHKRQPRGRAHARRRCRAAATLGAAEDWSHAAAGRAHGGGARIAGPCAGAGAVGAVVVAAVAVAMGNIVHSARVRLARRRHCRVDVDAVRRAIAVAHVRPQHARPRAGAGDDEHAPAAPQVATVTGTEVPRRPVAARGHQRWAGGRGEGDGRRRKRGDAVEVGNEQLPCDSAGIGGGRAAEVHGVGQLGAAPDGDRHRLRGGDLHAPSPGLRPEQLKLLE